MKTKILVLITLVLGVAMLFYWQQARPALDQHVHEAADIYYCPMHPDYQSDRPGKCPICHMNLVKKVTASTSATSQLSSHAAITLNNYQRETIAVKTSEAKRQTLTRVVHAYGRIMHNVDLYKLQDEYIKLYTEYVKTVGSDTRNRDQRRTWAPYRELQIKMLDAEHKLLELGLGHMQLEQLRQVDWRKLYEQPEFIFFKEDNFYWISAQLFEDDLGYVDVGQEVTIDVPAYKETFTGVVRSVGGMVDEANRTVRLLIEPQNNKGEFAVNMLANVTMKVDLENQLVIPSSAVMYSGKRAIVFVERTEGSFQPHEIQLGPEGEGYVAVRSGIKEGDRVVVNGNFLIDSESRLQAALRGFSKAEEK